MQILLSAIYLGKAGDKFNNNGELTDEETRKLIVAMWAAFVKWIEKRK